MKTKNIIKLNIYEIELLKNIEDFNEIETINDNLFYLFKSVIKFNSDIELETNKKLLKSFKKNLKYSKEIDPFYDIILVYNTSIASYMINKIERFVYSLCETNSKNILIGDHKEKWGGIVGHVTVNRKDLLIKILKYIISIRKNFPYISSSYTFTPIGFDIEENLTKKVNNYRSFYKFKWQKRIKKFYLKKNIYSKFSNKKKYKEDLIKNRKKIIKTKYRYIRRDNLS